MLRNLSLEESRLWIVNREKLQQNLDSKSRILSKLHCVTQWYISLFLIKIIQIIHLSSFSVTYWIFGKLLVLLVLRNFKIFILDDFKSLVPLWYKDIDTLCHRSVTYRWHEMLKIVYFCLTVKKWHKLK